MDATPFDAPAPSAIRGAWRIQSCPRRPRLRRRPAPVLREVAFLIGPFAGDLCDDASARVGEPESIARTREPSQSLKFAVLWRKRHWRFSGSHTIYFGSKVAAARGASRCFSTLIGALLLLGCIVWPIMGESKGNSGFSSGFVARDSCRYNFATKFCSMRRDLVEHIWVFDPTPYEEPQCSSLNFFYASNWNGRHLRILSSMRRNETDQCHAPPINWLAANIEIEIIKARRRFSGECFPVDPINFIVSGSGTAIFPFRHDNNIVVEYMNLKGPNENESAFNRNEGLSTYVDASLCGLSGPLSRIGSFAPDCKRTAGVSTLLYATAPSGNPKAEGGHCQGDCRPIEPKRVNSEPFFGAIPTIFGVLCGIIPLYIISVIPAKDDRDPDHRRKCNASKNNVAPNPPKSD